MTSAIVDAAAWLAGYDLDEHDWRSADAAAKAGLRAAPGAEQVWRLRFQALYQAGDHAGLQVAIAELERYNEAHGLDIETETVRCLDALRRRPEASHR